MKIIEINVFKRTHCGKTFFVIENKEEVISESDNLAEIAKDINGSPRLHKKETQLRIDCSPDCEISKHYGKKSSHNEALSEEEEKQLFEEINK